MSAVEVIEQIKALSPDEKAEVVKFMHQLDIKGVFSPEPRYMDQISFEAAKRRVFSKHSDLLNKLAK
jgi:hypothetical protein